MYVRAEIKVAQVHQLQTAGTCADCAAGTYAADGATDCQAHTSCGTQVAGGSRLTGESTTTAGTCAVCNAGTYAADGASNCQYI